MSDETVVAPDAPDLLASYSEANRAAIVQLFREEVQKAIAEQQAAGLPIFYGCPEDETDTLLMDSPDGRSFEYRLRADGTREIVREPTE